VTDPTATNQVRFIYDLIGRYIQDPNMDLFTPIQEHANKADNTPLELLVLAAGSIIAAANTLLESSHSTEQALERARTALLANDINEIFAATDEGTQ
jgi:hypothetical protein